MTPCSEPLHVVFGAGGPVGDEIVRQLVAAGRRVRAVNRRGAARLPDDVEIVRGDALVPPSALAACQGASVVYHTANARYTEWPKLLPPMMAGIIEAAASAGARIVYADNMYAYGPVDGLLTEDLPMRATGAKGATRSGVARRLMDAHKAGTVRATIGRAADFFGRTVRLSAVGERVFGHAVAGKKVDLLGDIEQPHTYTFLGDFARALIKLGERDEALGDVWHVPSAPTVTTRGFISILFATLGTPARVRVGPSWAIKAMGLFSSMARELSEMLYQFEQPFVVDASKFVRVFGDHSTPHPTAIAETAAWFWSARHG